MVLGLSVIVSLLAGTSTALGHPLALDRAAGLLPFFVLGFLCGRRGLSKLPSGTAVRTGALVGLVGTAWVAYRIQAVDVRWFYWNTTYRTLGASLVEGLTARVGLMVLALTTTVCMMVLLPRRRTLFTRCGEHSMFPYLLHPFATLSFAWSGYRPTTLWGFVLVCRGAVTLALARATPPVVRTLRHVVFPDVRWLFRRSRSDATLTDRRPAATHTV
jgi:fucose 4-O-acetylase-like acetyltransferase